MLATNHSQASVCGQTTDLLQQWSNSLCCVCQVMPSPGDFLHRSPLGRPLYHHAELVIHTCPKTVSQPEKSHCGKIYAESFLCKLVCIQLLACSHFFDSASSEL